MNHDAQRFEIEVLDVKQSDLAGSQTMAVGEQKDRFVPSVRCESIEQAGSLLERERLDRVRAHRGHRAIVNSTASARNNSFDLSNSYTPQRLASQGKTQQPIGRVFIVMSNSAGSLRSDQS